VTPAIQLRVFEPRRPLVLVMEAKGRVRHTQRLGVLGRHTIVRTITATREAVNDKRVALGKLLVVVVLVMNPLVIHTVVVRGQIIPKIVLGLEIKEPVNHIWVVLGIQNQPRIVLPSMAMNELVDELLVVLKTIRLVLGMVRAVTGVGGVLDIWTNQLATLQHIFQTVLEPM